MSLDLALDHLKSVRAIEPEAVMRRRGGAGFVNKFVGPNMRTACPLAGHGGPPSDREASGTFAEMQVMAPGRCQDFSFDQY